MTTPTTINPKTLIFTSTPGMNAHRTVVIRADYIVYLEALQKGTNIYLLNDSVVYVIEEFEAVHREWQEALQ